jgi:hypothetical protein
LYALYQHDDGIEVPARCAEYFDKFSRHNDETLNEYEIREREIRTWLREVHIDMPDHVAGWIALSRAGIPNWQEPNVRALRGGTLAPDKVLATLKLLYSGDHKPERCDVKRSTQRAQKGAQACACNDYTEEWHEEAYDDEAYYEDEEVH